MTELVLNPEQYKAVTSDWWASIEPYSYAQCIIKY
jgi:hypothetical protein